MFSFLSSKESIRKRALKNAGHSVMVDYLSTPFADKNARWDEIEIVALDFETTGLDPRHDQVLSYGKVHLRKGAIVLSSARHELVKPKKEIPESSAIIHHITDDQASQGRRIDQVMPELLHHLKGKVMLVHFNKIEQGFLDTICQKLYGSPFVIPIIDTLDLANRVISRRNHAIRPDRLRLFNLIDDFKLPHYKAHNAFYDALSTAELFLALEAEITPVTATRVKDLLV